MDFCLGRTSSTDTNPQRVAISETLLRFWAGPFGDTAPPLWMTTDWKSRLRVPFLNAVGCIDPLQLSGPLRRAYASDQCRVAGSAHSSRRLQRHLPIIFHAPVQTLVPTRLCPWKR